MHRDAEIRGQGPWRGGPDQREYFTASERRIDQRRIAFQRKLNVDGRTGMLLVFDFRFRERRLIVNAPVHGTGAFVNETSLYEAREQPRRFRFVVIGHRDVRTVPFAKDSQTLKISGLALERVRRKLATGAANTERRHVFLFFTKL